MAQEAQGQTVYISVGNSDDKLTQAEWSDFVQEIDELLEPRHIHGRWLSASDSAFQNACWCIEKPSDPEPVQKYLAIFAHRYWQDSIAWAEATTTFITAKAGVPAVK